MYADHQASSVSAPEVGGLPASVLDSLYSQIAIIDRMAKIHYVNRAWRDFGHHGLPSDHQWIGANYLEMFHRYVGHNEPPSGPVLPRIQAILDGHSDAFDCEYPCHTEQEKRWFMVRISAMDEHPGHFVVSHQNTTRRKQMLLAGQEALRATVQHSQAILDNMVDGVITINAQGQMESFNKAAGKIFGYSAEEVLGRNVSMLMPAPHRQHHDGYLQYFQRTGEARIIGAPREVEGQRKNGQIFPMSLSVSQVDRAGHPTFIGMVRDTTQRHRQDEEIRRLAFYDPLTGLPNRRMLMDRLKQAIASASRSRQHGAVMFLDLDHFKQLNDTRGHDVGDLLLKQVAQRLNECMREVDCVARLGGDEFVVLLEALSSQAHEAATQTEAIANKILYALSQPYTLREQIHESTPSIGIVVFAQDQTSQDELLKKADVAMYQAKSAGRNTACFFDPAMQAAVLARTELEKDLRQGLKQSEFVLYYQVQMDQYGTAVGAEALVRWYSPLRGTVPPAQFISLAEESGLILPLGQWVLETACAQLQAWALHPATARWTMAVNVSASQFAQADFVANVEAALQHTGANPHLLKLELTESMLVNDVKDVILKMNHLKSLGVCFSLDDFGTGYSSLSHLKRLPLDQLKIDQSFVRDILSDSSDAMIARTIVALGHNLGLTVIAEGVETADQRDFLAGLGCDAFQGYHFGRPAPAQSLEKFIKCGQ
jgi:diguanylate cyclase (GGDEF)-like protein/PAS domain S-box-containing protein